MLMSFFSVPGIESMASLILFKPSTTESQLSPVNAYSSYCPGCLQTGDMSEIMDWTRIHVQGRCSCHQSDAFLGFA